MALTNLFPRNFWRFPLSSAGREREDFSSDIETENPKKGESKRKIEIYLREERNRVIINLFSRVICLMSIFLEHEINETVGNKNNLLWGGREKFFHIGKL